MYSLGQVCSAFYVVYATFAKFDLYMGIMKFSTLNEKRISIGLHKIIYLCSTSLSQFARNQVKLLQHCSIVKPIGCTIFRVYWMSLYVFRTVFPSNIRSRRLYIQHQVYVIQVLWLLASRHKMEVHLLPTNMQSTNLYVQSSTPDDGRKGRLKHVE